MSLKTALYSYLSGVSGLNILVGTQIYPGVTPEGATPPYIIYSFVSTERVRGMSGATSVGNRRVQFDVYGTSALNVDNVCDALETALEAKRGDIGTEALSVLSSGLESERDDFIGITDGSEVGKHRRSIDYIIWHIL